MYTWRFGGTSKVMRGCTQSVTLDGSRESRLLLAPEQDTFSGLLLIQMGIRIASYTELIRRVVVTRCIGLWQRRLLDLRHPGLKSITVTASRPTIGPITLNTFPMVTMFYTVLGLWGEALSRMQVKRTALRSLVRRMSLRLGNALRVANHTVLSPEIIPFAANKFLASFPVTAGSNYCLNNWRGAGRAIHGHDETASWYQKNKDNMQLHPRTRAWIEAELGVAP